VDDIRTVMDGMRLKKSTETDYISVAKKKMESKLISAWKFKKELWPIGLLRRSKKIRPSLCE